MELGGERRLGAREGERGEGSDREKDTDTIYSICART